VFSQHSALGAAPEQVIRYRSTIMRSRSRWALLALALAVAGVTLGQENDAKNAPGPRPNPFPVEVRFADESTVKAALLDKSIEIATRYGKLTVPVEEIRSIEFGLRIPAETAKRIERAVSRLNSEDFAQREAASTELLELRELAFPALQQAARSTDAEVARRAGAAIKALVESVPPEKLHTPQHDTVVALDFSIVGRIETLALRARTPYFGETSLNLTDLRAMRWSANENEKKLAVDAARYGGQQEAWMDTGIKVRGGAGLLVTAAGTVDLQPADAGNVVVGPDGRNPQAARVAGGFGGGPGGGKGGKGNRGGGGGPPARPLVTVQAPGVLLGRVGEFGKVFIIGSQYEGMAAEEGKLYLRIVPSPAGESSGVYEVRVTTGR
jgi:hypothetical protein